MRYVDDIVFLKCIVINKISGYVIGDYNYWNWVYIGGCNFSYCIGGVWIWVDEYYVWFFSGVCIVISYMCCGLFVMN